MRQVLTIVTLVLVAALFVNCQLNDLLPPSRGRGGSFKNAGGNNRLLKTFMFDKASLNERPKTKNGYLPPEPPTYLPPNPPPYLPPKEISSTSTNGPTYLPPTTTRPSIRNYTYMPTMGTFPTARNYTYTTRQTTTYKPIRVPTTFPPLTTTRLTTQGYSYNRPDQAFIIEDLKK